MDCINRLEVILDKEVYSAGDDIHAYVVIDNSDNLKIRGIRAVLKGRAHAEWKIMRSGERRTVKDDQVLLDEKLLVWGKDRHEEGSFPILPVGYHRFPMVFSLPAGPPLPYSFESKSGTIRYFIRVVVDIPYASSPHYTKYFSLIGPPIDCMEEKYQTPMVGEDKRNDWSWCCLRGSIGLQILLDRTAYVCGEVIGVKVQVDSQIDQESWVKIRLTQHVEYFINKGVLGVAKTVSYVVLEHQTPRVLPRSRRRFDTSLEKTFKLPVVPPTLIGFCRLIQIYYVLTVSLEILKATKSRLSVDFPFTVATIPPKHTLKQDPALSYVYCASHVEGGMYVSPEFQLGQVYDGSTVEHDNVLLYRPLYLSLSDRTEESLVSANTTTVSPNDAGLNKPTTDGQVDHCHRLHVAATVHSADVNVEDAYLNFAKFDSRLFGSYLPLWVARCERVRYSFWEHRFLNGGYVHLGLPSHFAWACSAASRVRLTEVTCCWLAAERIMFSNGQDAVIKLNVGGTHFTTSRSTLTWIPDTFFTSLLSGRIPTLKDDSGAIFIDRDPKLFYIILNYMRSKQVDLREVELVALRHEAQFYGIGPLVRRLVLCDKLDQNPCGDVLFHGYFSPPTAIVAAGLDASNDCYGQQAVIKSKTVSHHRNLSEPIGFLSSNAIAPGSARPYNGTDLPWTSTRSLSNSAMTVPSSSFESLEGSSNSWDSKSTLNWRINKRPTVGRGKVHGKKVSLSGDYGKLRMEDSMLSKQRVDICPNSLQVRSIRGHQNWIAVAYSNNVVCYRLKGNVGWCLSFISPRTESTIRHVAINSKIVSQAEELVAVALENNLIILWSIGSEMRAVEIGRFLVPAHVHDLFFISSQLVALSKVGKIVIWHGMTRNWQIQDVSPICAYDTAGSFLLLGCTNGCIYYVDMQKFPLRIKDNDLLVMELHRDPLGDAITAINVYLTPKSTTSGNWLEIAYGTSSGTVRIIAQHPETAGQPPKLFQTFTVHRSRVNRVALTTAHLISVCTEYNHVRSWKLSRFRGMINTQPSSTPLASFKVMTLESADCPSDGDTVGDVGPFGDKDSEQVFVQKVVPDTCQLYIRLASTGERVCVIKACDGANITSFLVHEFEWSSGTGASPRRFLFTGHSNGSVQLWDLTTALDLFNGRKERPDYGRNHQGPTPEELLQLINECEITYQSMSGTPVCTPYGSSVYLPNVGSQETPNGS
uniref:BTB domain-containing protein n=1 Tax=Trichuris muris TaxID=70415 RepID=A0A5S6R438_TRIMR